MGRLVVVFPIRLSTIGLQREFFVVGFVFSGVLVACVEVVVDCAGRLAVVVQAVRRELSFALARAACLLGELFFRHSLWLPVARFAFLMVRIVSHSFA